MSYVQYHPAPWDSSSYWGQEEPGWPEGPAGSLGRALAGAGMAASAEQARRAVASRDFAWMSPVLADALPECLADIVAYPANAQELEFCLSAAYEHGVPVTVRGRGTGDCGQSVPLVGGLVVDTTGLDKVLEVGRGWARAQPGVSCMNLERAARATGQELCIMPSTTSSTIGGFVATGSAGCGSVEYGPLEDGLVQAVSVLGLCSSPTPVLFAQAAGLPGAIDLTGRPAAADLRYFLHSSGTVGVASELTVTLAPARKWTGVAVSFADLKTAASAALSLLSCSLPLRLLSVSEAALVQDFPEVAWLPRERASLRAIVESAAVPAAQGALGAAGARVEATGEELVGPITQLSFNHVTLRAKRCSPNVYHLPVSGVRDKASLAVISRLVPKSRLHFDTVRSEGQACFEVLVVAPYQGKKVLDEAVEALAAEGLAVKRPHSWAVADADGSLAELAAKMDPAGLLNPGKLARPGLPLVLR